ncbi:MAG: gamma-glutamyltransferase [Verrucomicrobiota bacterium]
MLIRILALCFLWWLSCPFEIVAADRITGKSFATRSEVIATQGMAATSQPLATQVALDILKQGGSAVDAAIGANAALALMEPTSNGIGGDLFAIVWDPITERLHGLNASGRSPRALTKSKLAELGHAEKIPIYGVHSVSIPGCIDGWFELHDKFGKLSMQEILGPTIRYAREGHPVSELIAFYWDRSVRGRGKRDDMPGFMETFAPGGTAPAKGDIWKNPALANTLEALATEGRSVFYEGRIAQVMARFLRAHGGLHSVEDFARHTSEWVDPVSTNYRGWDVWELPPNGQGIAALQILNILEPYDLASYGFGSLEHIHLFLEAKKLAYEDRAAYYGDPAFSKTPVDFLISKAYAEDRRKQISMERAGKNYDPGVLRHGDTIYLATADSEGMMVSLIQSNFYGFGSGVCVPELGFGFQNRGSSFVMDSGHANEYAPGKRPFHTIIPCFVTEDGKPLIAYGVMGGDMQPQGHVQIVLNMKDFGMNLQEAGDAPRIHHTGSTNFFEDNRAMEDGGEVNLEDGFSMEVRRDLELMGHRLETAIGPFGGYQAIMRDPETGVYYGASESRKDGHAAGY